MTVAPANLFKSHDELREEKHCNKLTHNECQAKFSPRSLRKEKNGISKEKERNILFHEPAGICLLKREMGQTRVDK